MQQPPDPYDQTTRQYAPPPPPVAPPHPMQPMPPQRPNALNRSLTWYRRQTRPMQIIVAIVALAAVIFVGSAAISGIVQGSQQALEPTPTVASQPTPTSAPTQAPTPTPILTASQRIDQLVHANASNAAKVDVTDNDGKTVNVQITLNSAGDNGTYQSWIRQNCFAIEKATWTAGISGLKDLNLAFRGTAFPGPIGRCEVTSTKNAGVHWSSLSADSAWPSAYDLAQYYPAIK